MTEPADSPEGIARYAREGGKRSGQMRRRLTFEDVQTELGELRTPADAKRWLAQVIRWGTGGQLPGTMVNACASCVREWLKAHAEELDFDRVRALEREVRELKAAREGS